MTVAQSCCGPSTGEKSARFRLVLLLVLMLGLSGQLWAAEPILIRFSHALPQETPRGQAIEKFKALAESYTRGRVRVEVHHDGRLFSHRDELKALQRNQVQMLAPELSALATLDLPAFEVFDLPYLFPSLEVVHRVVDGEPGRSLFAQLETKPVIGLAWWDDGFRQLGTNRPLRSLSRLKGLRIAISPSSVLTEQMKALGARPRPVFAPEQLPGLQQGGLDGIETTFSTFYALKLHSQPSHLTISDHGYQGYAVVANRRFWQGLPPGVRTQLERALRETTSFERTTARRANLEALARIRAAGTTTIHILSDAERLNGHRMLLPVHQAFEPRLGRGLIQSIYRAAAQVEAGTADGSVPAEGR